MDEFNNQMKIITSLPLSFKFAKWLQRKNVPGGYRLEQICRSTSLWDVKVRYFLRNNVVIDIPYVDYKDTYPNIMEYEKKSINYISGIMSQFDEPFVLIDCGADIGLMTSRLISECPNIKRAIAFEPNPTSYPFLNNNVQLLGIQAEAKMMAISDFTGRAELHFPDFDSHNHAAFIVPSEAGPISVCAIDDLGLPAGSSILLKIDVEGEEYSVIRGATKTLSRVNHFVVIFEAHHEQVQRTKIDPVNLITYLSKLRPCKSTVVEATDSEIDLNRPFFEQFISGIYNICVYST